MDKNRFKEMAVRTASGVAMLLIFVGAVLWSPWSAKLLFAVIMFGGLVEFYNLCRKSGYKPMYVFGILASLSIFSCLAIPTVTNYGDDLLMLMLFALLVLFIMIPALFVCEIWRKSETPIANVATTFMGVLYVALPMSLLMFVPSFLAPSKSPEWNPWLLIAFMSIIWSNDVFAYLVGVTIGKHRMCERISPKKSWEGFVGGVVCAVGVAILFGYLFEANMIRWAIMGLIAAVTGVAGDLVESMFKREAGVKDSGKIMPGHGGFLDRFDALFISVPFVVLYLVFSYSFA